MTSPSTFGDLLKQLRKRAGMTQGDFAAAVGYSVSFICNLEQNQRLPTVDVVLKKFVPALGLQEDARIAAGLVELAALARSERPPTLTFQRTNKLVVTDTLTFPPSRLPAPPTGLIGREQTVKAICNRLPGHSGRLLTLVGPPGVGKTRLGLEVAHRLEPLFKDGARFVALAAVTNPELVATVIANELELADTGKQAQQRVIQGLRHKELLLVLDNFEQILTAAPLLATLVAECHRLHLLVTSRERLHLRVEQRFLVPPLDLTFAVTLFVQRAQAVEPAFEPTAAMTASISQICQRLDCLPLAIELIAARIDLFSPQAMLTRLQTQGLELLTGGAQDAPAHQRTLRQAIHHSDSLLTDRERALFRTLGVFVDGFDLEAVTYFGFDAEILYSLLHKSLVQVAVQPSSGKLSLDTERRFRLLEMLREYAYEQLTLHQEADTVQDQHAAYYLQVVEQVEPKLWEAQAANWLAYLETEHNNVRSALTWTLATGDMTTALRLCGALGFFWDRHGHLHEGKQWLEKVLAASSNAPPLVRAKALSAAGMMEHNLGNHGQAQRLVEQSLAIYQTINDQRNIAEKSMLLGGIFRKQHLYAQAQFFYEQSFKLFQLLEDPGRMAAVRSGLGNLAMNQGDYAQAQMHYEQGLAGYRASGNKLWIAEILPNMARLAIQQGEHQRAFVYCEEMLALTQELGDQDGVLQALNQLSHVMLLQGQIDQAAHYLTRSLRLAQELDYPPRTASVLTQQGNLAFAQADFVRAGRCYVHSLQIAHQLMDRLEIANELENLAGVANAQHRAASAIKLLGAAESLRKVIGAPLPTSAQPHYQQMITTVQTQLDETSYTSAYAAGYAMTAEQAVAFALAQFDRSQNDMPQA